LITQLPQPIDKFEPTFPKGAFVLSTLDGALWRTDGNTKALLLRGGGSHVNCILVPPGQQIIYAGYANGDVLAIDTKSWRPKMILQGPGAVQELAVTSDGHTIAVATGNGAIHIGTQRDETMSFEDATWVTLEARARHITFAPDGLLVAACTDGTIRLYSTQQRRWLCLPTGTVDLVRSIMTANGKTAVSFDREGRLIWIDLEAARKLL
jgi:WD40 repeat protein